MVDVTTHNERESPHPCRPQNIRIGSGLSAAFQRSLVNRAELVHVITLIGTGTGIHKGEHTGYKQSGFVVRHRIRSGKDGTCFTVFSLTITEEQGIRSRIVMPQFASLPYKTTGKHSTVVHTRTG